MHTCHSLKPAYDSSYSYILPLQRRGQDSKSMGSNMSAMDGWTGEREYNNADNTGSNVCLFWHGSALGW